MSFQRVTNGTAEWQVGTAGRKRQLRSGAGASAEVRYRSVSIQARQKPGTACQARPGGGASSRVTVPSISPYGRSAA
jgi:hypothetical protein